LRDPDDASHLRVNHEEAANMMRRRPLARAAVVGGVAYHAGKRGQQNRDAEAYQDEQIAELQAQQQSAPPPPAAAPASAVGGDDMVSQLENLKKLLDQGILTQAEFDMQKQKILAGG
jgi:hypothetical protein